MASRGQRRGRLSRWVLAASLVAGVPSAARGEPTAADKETARSLLTEGDRKRDAKDLRGALDDYQAADAIMGVPTTGIEVARTEERLGMLVEARDIALRIARLPVSSTEPRAFRQARDAAERLAAELALRIPSIRVAVRGAPAERVTLQVDGAVIPKAAAAMPRKVDPGEHVVVAYADGYERVTAELTVEERETRDVELSLASSKESSRDPPGSVVLIERDGRTTGASSLPAASDRQPAESPTSPFLYIGGSIAAAGLAVGTIAGIAELGQKSKAETACSRWGDIECSAAYDSAHELATISNVSFGVGALGAAVAIFALVRQPGRPRGSAFRSNLMLVVKPNAASVVGTF